MSGTDFLRMILAKYNVYNEFAQYSFTLPSASTGVFSLSAKYPYVVYLLDFFAFSSDKTVSLDMYDSSNQLMFGTNVRVVSLPIPFTFYKLIPENRLYGPNNVIGAFSSEATLTVEFKNNESFSVDVDTGLNTILIPLSEAEEFEAEIKSFDLGNSNIISKLEKINKSIIGLKDGFKPEFMG